MFAGDMNGRFLACDLGAESGRVILGVLEGGRLGLFEKHRFATGHCTIGGTMRWDVPFFWEEIKKGVAKAGDAESVSVDSWGVDYVWIREDEPLVTLPFHYRDGRTVGGYERLRPKVSQWQIYQSTGIQMMELNTLVQMHEDLLRRPHVFKESTRFLTMGDYFNSLLGGEKVIEESLASTTQMCDARTRSWSDDLISRVGVPRELFPAVVPSGTVTGSVSQDLVDDLGFGKMKVVATCSHDTGAAVAAVPATTGEDWAYLSSGTWSLLGVELDKPKITGESFHAGFTNELGYGGIVRFLKNIVGLWIIQECRRYWQREGRELDYDELMQLAKPHMSEDLLIRPDDTRFYAPGKMPEKIRAFCRETGQAEPCTPGGVVACVLRSLACLYAEVLEDLENITGRVIKHLHIIGGGSRNELLNKATADITGRTVLAGPVEATAIGNVLLQALTLGRINSLNELRQVVRDSSEVRTYKPSRGASFDSLMEKFSSLKNPSANPV